MSKYAWSIWDCRHFLMCLVRNDLHMRYRGSLLGVGWSLLHPLTTTLVTCLVFHKIFKVDVESFAPFVLSGLACWGYITSVAIQGCQSYVQAESYIRQHPLPIAVYPLRTTLVAMTHFLIALAVVVAMTWSLQGFGNAPALIFLLFGVMVLFVFGWAVAVIMGFIHLLFRDTQHLLEMGFQVLFYLTPIIYPVQALTESKLAWVVRFNPLVRLLDLIRAPLLAGRPPSLTSCGVAVTMTLALTAIAVASLRYQQRRVILYL